MQTRATIRKFAAFLTLSLFTSEALAVGESVSCKLTSSIDLRAQGYPKLEWRVSALFNDDPNQANDAVVIPIILFNPPAPVPANQPLLLLLLFAIVVRSVARRL